MPTPGTLPYLAPWASEFNRYSTQQFDLLAGQASSPVTSGSFLGAFTVAQWPPSAGAAGQGQSALLADTTGGITFAWLLEYRPDLDATYPWRSYGGDTACVAALDWTGTVSGSGGGTHAVASAMAVPLAGSWAFDLAAHGDNSAGGTLNGQITTAAAGGSVVASVYLDWATNQGSAYSNGNAFTATKGQQLYYSFAETSGAYTKTMYLMAGRCRPVKVANS